MLIVDAHLDLSWNALQWNRDLLRSVYTIRTQENLISGKGRGMGTVAYPEMRQGRVALTFATLLARSTGQPVPHIDFANPAQSYGIARGQLHYYEALERQGEICIVRDRDSLKQLWEQWSAWEQAGAEGATSPLGFVISMEGADPIQQPEQLEEWHGRTALTWDYPLWTWTVCWWDRHRDWIDSVGYRCCKRWSASGIALDLTHCSDQAFWEA